MARQKPG